MIIITKNYIAKRKENGICIRNLFLSENNVLLLQKYPIFNQPYSIR